MRRIQVIAIGIFIATGCGASQVPEQATGDEHAGGSQSGASGEQGLARDDEFQLATSETAGQARGERPSEIEATESQAAMRLFVVNPDTGPIQGIVIKMTAPDGTAYYTGETDGVGYAEVLVPVDQRYEMEYLSLGRQTTTAAVQVEPGPNQDIRLTMRYRRRRERPVAAPPIAPTSDAAPPAQGLVLEGILFDTGRATIRAESHARLDRVVEYMAHRVGARIRISGHTDNVGNPQRNQALSEARAQAVGGYLVEHGIAESRVDAVGYGDQHPIASNDTEEGRQQNRRIEAVEL